MKRFADAGEGTVIYMQGEYLLLVRAHVVAMLIDGDTVYILHVRSARNG